MMLAKKIELNAERKQTSCLPDCLKCKHFYVTYDPKFPRGCRVYRFKSNRPPSRVVLESSGSHCQLFLKKEIG